MLIFDVLRDILRDKTGTLDQEPDFKQAFSAFMVNRYLSMHEQPEVRDVALNAAALGLHDMGAREYYQYLVSAVPQTSCTYIRYFKKASKTISGETKQSPEKPKKALPAPRPS